MPRSTMKVALIRHTLSPEEVVALGARLCYSRATVDSLQQRVSRDDQSEFVSRILSMGHESVLEHASFTFAMEGVSRVLLAQITRHRLASFSVQSQRYVSYEKGFGYIVPPKIEALGEDAVAEFERQMDTMHQWYTGWQEKLGAGEGGNEDARFVLPRLRNAHDGDDERARAAALLQPAHVQPRTVGNPRAGDGNAPPVHGNCPGAVCGRGARMSARRVSGRGKILRQGRGDSPDKARMARFAGRRTEKAESINRQ